nr:MAG TPA: hypothetical protein [Caudoviricetes sp.]
MLKVQRRRCLGLRVKTLIKHMTLYQDVCFYVLRIILVLPLPLVKSEPRTIFITPCKAPTYTRESHGTIS